MDAKWVANKSINTLFTRFVFCTSHHHELQVIYLQNTYVNVHPIETLEKPQTPYVCIMTTSSHDFQPKSNRHSIPMKALTSPMFAMMKLTF